MLAQLMRGAQRQHVNRGFDHVVRHIARVLDREATPARLCDLAGSRRDRTWTVAVAISSRPARHIDRPARLAQTNCDTASDPATGSRYDRDLAFGLHRQRQTIARATAPLTP